MIEPGPPWHTAMLAVRRASSISAEDRNRLHSANRGRRDVPTWSEFELLRDAFTGRGVPTVVCDPRELTLEGGVLRAAGAAVDLVYRRVLINDIVARQDDCRALVDAYAQRVACVANSLRCKIPHKKAFFAVLTDERRSPLFTDQEREIIRRHVPWTVLVSDGRAQRDGRSFDLLTFIRRDREQLVIKPNDEYGGASVTLGWETGDPSPLIDQVADRSAVCLIGRGDFHLFLEQHRTADAVLLHQLAVLVGSPSADHQRQGTGVGR